MGEFQSLCGFGGRLRLPGTVYQSIDNRALGYSSFREVADQAFRPLLACLGFRVFGRITGPRHALEQCIEFCEPLRLFNGRLLQKSQFGLCKPQPAVSAVAANDRPDQSCHNNKQENAKNPPTGRRWPEAAGYWQVNISQLAQGIVGRHPILPPGPSMDLRLTAGDSWVETLDAHTPDSRKHSSSLASW